MQKNNFYRNEFIYNGWKVMMIKVGTGSTVTVNYWPAINLDKLNEIKRTDKELSDKMQLIISKCIGSFPLTAPGWNPDLDILVSAAKHRIDNTPRRLDLAVRLRQL